MSDYCTPNGIIAPGLHDCDILDPSDFTDATDSGYQQSVNRAISAANARGGGSVAIPNLGTPYALTSQITLQSNVFLVGAGFPTLRLNSGVGTTVIEGQNYLALTGTNSGAGVSNCGVSGIIVDGNRAGNPSPGTNQGHGIALYGRDVYLSDIKIINAARRGLSTEYGNTSVGTSPYNGHLRTLLVNTCGEEGWYNVLSDIHADDLNIRYPSQSANLGFDAIYLGPSGSIRGSNINVWNNPALTHRYGVNIDTPSAVTISGIHLETGGTAAMMINSGTNAITGLMAYNPIGAALVIIRGNENAVSFTAFPSQGSASAVPLILGQSGDAPLGNAVDMRVTGFSGNLADFTNSGGNNRVNITGFHSGSGLMTGTPQVSDRLYSDLSGGAVTKVFGGRSVGTIAIGDTAAAINSGSVAIGAGCSAFNSGVAIGTNNTASQFNTHVTGSRASINLWGARVHSAGRLATDGDAQQMDLQWRGTTTDATPTEIFLDGASQRARMPLNTSWTFDILLTARTTAGGADRMSRRIVGMINEGSTTGSANIPSAVTVTDINVATGFNATATADTVNDSLMITVTGAAAKTVRWLAQARICQITG